MSEEKAGGVKRFIITTEDCPFCDDLKGDLSTEIKTGQIKNVDVTEQIPRNMAPIIREFNIDAVPQIMTAEKLPDGTTKVCDERTKTCKIIREDLDI